MRKARPILPADKCVLNLSDLLFSLPFLLYLLPLRFRAISDSLSHVPALRRTRALKMTTYYRADSETLLALSWYACIWGYQLCIAKYSD